MMKGGLDAEIDKLYQGPLEDFTAARNVLAKGAGKRAAEVRALAKPAAPAWAVNQLYWRRRAVYDALMDAARALRQEHADVLAGRKADVRGASKTHEERVAAALDATLEILLESGHPPTDATRQALATTLRALPGDEPAGHLTRALQPGGFEALAGLSIRGAKAPAMLKPAAKPPARHAGDRDTAAPKQNARDAKALAKAKEAVAAAARALKIAEHTAQREEFERARAARDEEKAAKSVTAAQAAVEEAESELRDAEAAAAAAVKKREAAERRAHEADTSLDAARAALEAAQQQVAALTD